MSTLPQNLLNSLKGIKGFNEQSFIDVHNSDKQVTSVRFNPAKVSVTHLPVDTKIPWSSHGYYLTERPFFTFDPLLHAGVYYVQEASGMFLEEALKQTTDLSKTLRVLDLCAAPGGKSTLIQSLITADSLLVSNEVIKQRASILEENIIKWGAPNVIVTNSDPVVFQQLENYFDVIVVDAPCSGSGLFRKDAQAIEEWSENNVQLCSQRQQRILADVYPALKKDGLLIYATCSYSEEEDECIADWVLDQFAVNSLQLNINDEWGIVETISKKHAAFAYRFFPDQVKGEGFFIACFRKLYGDERHLRSSKKSKLQIASKAEDIIIRPWLNENIQLQLWKQGDRLFAFPAALTNDLLYIVSSEIYIRNAGVGVGVIAGKNLIPDHALAVSNILNPSVVAVSLKKEEALQYLRKEEVSITPANKGWAVVQYEGVNLGWVKILLNRSNNYYPKEWRILKSRNN